MILGMFKSEDGVDFVGGGLAGPRMAHAEFPSPELIPDTEKWVKASFFFFSFLPLPYESMHLITPIKIIQSVAVYNLFWSSVYTMLL